MTGPPVDRDPPYEHVSPETLHALVVSLTVIRGQTQMLERQIRRDRIMYPDSALFRLAIIDTMVRRIVDQLNQLPPPVKNPPTK